MNVVLYRFFDKKINSTKQPTSNDNSITIDCKLLDDTSITSPVLLIEKTGSMLSMDGYTYAYIADLGTRYYFVVDYISHRNLWIVKLSVDVLATYKHDINQSSQYVLRSAVTFDNDIVDGIYPTINKDYINNGSGTLSSFYSSSQLTPNQSGQYEIHRRAVVTDGAWSVDRMYFKTGVNSGGFIVGVVSDNGTGNTYYAMIRSSLVTFMNKVLTLTPSDFTDTSTGVARALINGIQYITSITWYPALPAKPGSLSYETTIQIGGYGVDVTGLSIFNIASNYIEEFYFDLDLPKHPKRNTTAYGVLQWLTLSPYTQYNLYYAPFGNIPIDTTKLLYSSAIRVNWMIDFTTGNSILKIMPSDATSHIVYTGVSTLGVSMPVSSLTVKNLTGLGLVTAYMGLKSIESDVPKTSGIVDWFKEHTTDWSWLDDRLKPSYWMEKLGFQKTSESVDLSTAIDMGVDAVASALGQVQTQGVPDSFLAYYEMPILYAYFLDIAQPDKERFGRPLNQTKTLSTITGGFCKCADSNVAFSDKVPTLPERNKVNSMLNSGVFLE